MTDTSKLGRGSRPPHFNLLHNFAQLSSNFKKSLYRAFTQLKQLNFGILAIQTNKENSIYYIIYSCISCITFIAIDF